MKPITLKQEQQTKETKFWLDDRGMMVYANQLEQWQYIYWGHNIPTAWLTKADVGTIIRFRYGNDVKIVPSEVSSEEEDMINTKAIVKPVDGLYDLVLRLQNEAS